MKSLAAQLVSGKSKLSRAFQFAGLMIVFAVNIFVFGSDFIAAHFNYTPSFEKFFLHVSEEHKINQSPFKITLRFKMVAAPSMEPATEIPRIIIEIIPAILFAATLLLSILSFYSVILFGEKIRSAVFDPSLNYPPPKRIF